MILEQIIREYVNNPEPIGSENLRLKLGIKISSATIRNYFNKLSEEGALTKVHLSSGRIPTNRALKLYWSNKLLPLSPLKTTGVEQIKDSARSIGLFCIVKFYQSNRFLELVEVPDRYLIMVFNEGEVVIDHTPVHQRFLQEMVGMELEDIHKICVEVQAEHIRERLERFVQDGRLEKEGSVELVNMMNESDLNSAHLDAMIDGTMVDRISDGIYFHNLVPEGYLAIKQDVRVSDENAKLFFIGKLHRNYENFYHQATQYLPKES